MLPAGKCSARAAQAMEQRCQFRGVTCMYAALESAAQRKVTRTGARPAALCPRCSWARALEHSDGQRDAAGCATWRLTARLHAHATWRRRRSCSSGGWATPPSQRHATCRSPAGARLCAVDCHGTTRAGTRVVPVEPGPAAEGEVLEYPYYRDCHIKRTRFSKRTLPTGLTPAPLPGDAERRLRD